MDRKIGVRPYVDFAFRKVFSKPGNEPCLISLLNAILNKTPPIESVQIQNPFSIQEFQEDKGYCVDVKAIDQAGHVFIVEVQIVLTDNFQKRAVFYACSAYTDQLRKGNGYEDLKPTYCISILTRKLFPDSLLHHRITLSEKTGRQLDDTIEIHTIELAKYNTSLEGTRDSSLLDQWCYWIKNAHLHGEPELLSLSQALPIRQATMELRDIQNKSEEKAMYDSREKAILDYESNLIDARSEGRRLGREEGREEGRDEGEKIGMEIGRIQLLQELLGIEISSITGLNPLPLQQLTSLREALQNQLRERSA